MVHGAWYIFTVAYARYFINAASYSFILCFYPMELIPYVTFYLGVTQRVSCVVLTTCTGTPF
jgi:hypothetical protein